MIHRIIQAGFMLINSAFVICSKRSGLFVGRRVRLCIRIRPDVLFRLFKRILPLFPQVVGVVVVLAARYFGGYGFVGVKNHVLDIRRQGDGSIVLLRQDNRTVPLSSSRLTAAQ